MFIRLTYEQTVRWSLETDLGPNPTQVNQSNCQMIKKPQDQRNGIVNNDTIMSRLFLTRVTIRAIYLAIAKQLTFTQTIHFLNLISPLAHIT